MQKFHTNCLFKKNIFSFPDFSRFLLMINIQKDWRNNKSIEFGLRRVCEDSGGAVGGADQLELMLSWHYTDLM